MATRARGWSRGTRIRTSSMIVGIRSGHDTHATHVRCVESGRWNAWGSSPTPNSPAAARVIARGAPAGAAVQPEAGAGDEDGDDGQREEPQEQLMAGGDGGEPPPRRHFLGDRLERTVEDVPARWARQLAPGPQPHHRVDQHRLDGATDADPRHVDEQRQQTDDDADQVALPPRSPPSSHP